MRTDIFVGFKLLVLLTCFLVDTLRKIGWSLCSASSSSAIRSLVPTASFSSLCFFMCATSALAARSTCAGSSWYGVSFCFFVVRGASAFFSTFLVTCFDLAIVAVYRSGKVRSSKMAAVLDPVAIQLFRRRSEKREQPRPTRAGLGWSTSWFALRAYSFRKIVDASEPISASSVIAPVHDTLKHASPGETTPRMH